jgi:hypothetical protein
MVEHTYYGIMEQTKDDELIQAFQLHGMLAQQWWSILIYGIMEQTKDDELIQAFQLHVFHTVIRCKEYRMSPN